MFGKKKYYDIKPLMSKGATYSMVFGKRSNGKTHSALEYALNRWKQDGSTTAYIRRWKEDVTGARAGQLLADFNAMGKVKKITKIYDGITYYNRIQYFCNYDDNGKADKQLPFMYMFSLSDMEHDKSTQYPTVGTIIFDEFISRGGYFPDEFISFTNVLSTIIRDRTDVRIIMLGNTVNKFCPYFKEMGITRVNKMKQGTIDVYTYGNSDLSVAVEYCGDNASEYDNNNHYFAFENPKLKMITKGEWELPVFPHTSERILGKDILYSYFIEFNDRVFQGDIVNGSNGLFMHIHDKTTPIKNPDKDLIYTLDTKEGINYYRNILSPDNKVRQKIAKFFATGKVFYSNNDVGNYIQGYMREMVKNG